MPQKKNQDFTDIEALKEELGAILTEKTKDIFPSRFRRFLIPIIPDPNQLSIPSEPTVRGDFTSRLPRFRNTIEGFMVDRKTKEKGNEIVLNSILKQLKSFPSLRSEEDRFAHPGLDIFFSEIFNSEDFVTNQKDQGLKRLERAIDEAIEGGVGT